MILFEILAQASNPAAPPTTQSIPPLVQLLSSPMFPLLLVFLVFFIFMSRSKGGEKKQRQNMLAALKKGDKVQTIGGIVGTVMDVRDADVLLKVDETSNTKMRFIRSAIHRVVEEDKIENK